MAYYNVSTPEFNSHVRRLERAISESQRCLTRR